MLSSRPISVFNDGGVTLRPKTPARGGGGGRENAVYPQTVAKGKGLAGKNVNLHTPFHAGPAAGASKPLLKTAPRLRPLVDKTPMPNRTLNLNPESPDSGLRPSSLRKHSKAPRGSLGKGFQTPLNNGGNYWEAGDVSLAEPEVQAEAVVLEPEDDFEEVEYCPPNTLDLPYQPPFDFALPNYEAVGADLMALSYARVFLDEAVAPRNVEPTFTPSDTLDVSIKLPEFVDVDDPFYVPPPKAKTPAPASRSQSQNPRARAPVKTPVPLPHARQPVSRPATSASVRRPATAMSTTTAMSGRATAMSGRTTQMSSRPPVSARPVSRAAVTTARPASTTARPASTRPASRAAATTTTTARGRTTAISTKAPAAKPLVSVVANTDEDFLFDI